jgi:hypothetical protein
MTHAPPHIHFCVGEGTLDGRPLGLVALAGGAAAQLLLDVAH